MTLCVAAECRQYKRFFNAVVIANDFQVEGQTARADIGTKVCEIGHEFFPVLMAGTQTRAVELAMEINRALRETRSPLGKDYIAPDWDTVLNSAVLWQKHRIANEIVCGRFGITYDEFLKIGREKFPPDIYRDTIAEIGRAPLDCWLLVIAFSQTTPTIFRISDTGVVERCENFAAIGSGLYLAESALFQRSQNSGNDLGTTIYNIFEAMRMGSRAPGVGDQFQIALVQWEYWENQTTNEGSIKWSYITVPYYQFLEKQFQRYGPKSLSQVKIRPGFIKEKQRALVLTPKGEANPEHIAAAKRAQAAREREAKKREFRRSDSRKPEPDK